MTEPTWLTETRAAYDTVAALPDAGLTVRATLVREEKGVEKGPQALLLAVRPDGGADR